MILGKYLKNVSRGQYHEFRCYLNRGVDGEPVRYLDLSEELCFVKDKPKFLTHLFEALLETKVDKLDLSLNEIDDAGAEKIGEAIKLNKKLIGIFLAFNKIDTAGVSALLRCITPEHNLEYIDLSCNVFYLERTFDIRSMITFLKEESIVVETVKSLLPSPISNQLLFHFVYISQNFKNPITANSLLPDRKSLNGSLSDSDKSNIVDILSSQAEANENMSLQSRQQADDVEFEELTHLIKKPNN